MKVVEKVKQHILCSITLFENRALYEIMWKSIVQTDRQTDRQATGGNIIRRMRFVCWITKATDTNGAYVMLTAFARQ